MTLIEIRTFGKTLTTLCPECDYQLDLGFTPEIDETIICPDCYTYLQVISLYPLELDCLEHEDMDELTNYLGAIQWEVDYFEDDIVDDEDADWLADEFGYHLNSNTFLDVKEDI